MKAREVLRKIVTAILTNEQWEALDSWADDVLSGRVDGLEDGLGTTKLIYHVNRGETQLAAAEFSKWCLVKGHINTQALATRRAEAQHFIRGANVSPLSR